ncbi:MAG: hypothetical protein H6813_03625 [Phycisphaeraceae bacterium]|nr:hypothetical protein [Phycisphaeraceae bacterium]MCB9847037.1 hypothetical protein [Phycisphaeraceae bacterium]
MLTNTDELNPTLPAEIGLNPMGPFVVNPPTLPIPQIEPGGSFVVDSFFDITYVIDFPGADGPTVMGDILVEFDADGNGSISQDEVVGSLTVRGELTLPGPCPADLNGDGVVDTADLGILLGEFGTMCL